MRASAGRASLGGASSRQGSPASSERKDLADGWALLAPKAPKEEAEKLRLAEKTDSMVRVANWLLTHPDRLLPYVSFIERDGLASITLKEDKDPAAVEACEKIGQLPRVFVWEWVAGKQPLFTPQVCGGLERSDRGSYKKVLEYCTGLGETAQVPQQIRNKPMVIELLDARYEQWGKRLSAVWFKRAVVTGAEGKVTINWSSKGVGAYDFEDPKEENKPCEVCKHTQLDEDAAIPDVYCFTKDTLIDKNWSDQSAKIAVGKQSVKPLTFFADSATEHFKTIAQNQSRIKGMAITIAAKVKAAHAEHEKAMAVGRSSHLADELRTVEDEMRHKKARRAPPAGRPATAA
eukprot:TRINITY_DN91775_c0_g1_i1.p1 TRINITY_DN91775_c0_g1~~TRINITY_DN91775_c0_g1_i1.p1  ORF type:complete len:366 (+),score=85.27 TRINITY_DN91775_c0_g1_i1:59-1099(+)